MKEFTICLKMPDFSLFIPLLPTPLMWRVLQGEARLVYALITQMEDVSPTTLKKIIFVANYSPRGISLPNHHNWRLPYVGVLEFSCCLLHAVLTFGEKMLKYPLFREENKMFRNSRSRKGQSWVQCPQEICPKVSVIIWVQCKRKKIL